MRVLNSSSVHLDIATHCLLNALYTQDTMNISQNSLKLEGFNVNTLTRSLNAYKFLTHKDLHKLLVVPTRALQPRMQASILACSWSPMFVFSIRSAAARAIKIVVMRVIFIFVGG